MPVMRLEGRQGYVRLNPGKNYYWKVVEASLKYSQKGDDQIQLVLLVGDRSRQAKVYETLTFSDNAYFRVEEFLKSAGRYSGDDVEVYFDDTDLVNLTGVCTVRYEYNEQKKRDYPRIEKWVEANRQTPDPAWAERARLNKRSPAPLPDEPPPGAGIDPDDIPF